MQIEQEETRIKMRKWIFLQWVQDSLVQEAETDYVLAADTALPPTFKVSATATKLMAPPI